MRAGILVYFYAVTIIDIVVSGMMWRLLKNSCATTGTDICFCIALIKSSIIINTFLLVTCVAGSFCWSCIAVTYWYNQSTSKSVVFEFSCIGNSVPKSLGDMKSTSWNFLLYNSPLMSIDFIRVDLPLPGFPTINQRKLLGMMLPYLRPYTPSRLFVSFLTSHDRILGKLCMSGLCIYFLENKKSIIISILYA